MTDRARTRERRNTSRVEATKQSTELENAARLGPPPLNIHECSEVTGRESIEKQLETYCNFYNRQPSKVLFI